MQAVVPVFKKLLDLGAIRVHDIPQEVIEHFQGKNALGVDIENSVGEIGSASNVDWSKYQYASEPGVIGHEITHDYQRRGGKSSDKSPFGGTDSPYNYGSNDQLNKLRKQGYRFSDMSKEQQARLVEDYINLSQDRIKMNPHIRDVRLQSIQPFIDDLRRSQSYKTVDTPAKAKLEAAKSAPVNNPNKNVKDDPWLDGDDLIADTDLIPGSVNKPEMKPLDPQLEASLPPFLRKIGARLGYSGNRQGDKIIAHVDAPWFEDKRDIKVDMPELFTRAILAHEATHVFQHTRKEYARPPISSVGEYKDTYDYGGLDGLEQAADLGKTIADFTNEKQAKIIEDYYRVHVHAIRIAQRQGGHLTTDQALQYERIRNAVSRLAGQLAQMPSENEPDSDKLPPLDLAPKLPSFTITGRVELDPNMVGVMLPIPVKDTKKK